MFQKIIFKHTKVQHLSCPPVVIFSLLFLVKNNFFWYTWNLGYNILNMWMKEKEQKGNSINTQQS